MSPPISIVIFTVLSGAGLGLAAMLAALGFGDSEKTLWTAAVLSLLLMAGGLSASVGHLANPKNAWRAFMRVKTSWLSREAVLAAVFFPLFLLWVYLANDGGFFAELLRVGLVIIALLTVFCTAMIYQSLKPIPQWHHPLTAVSYLLLALASGALLLSIISAAFDVVASSATVMTMCWAIAAALAKAAHYWRIGKAKGITIGRAIGYSQAAARLLDAGHSGPTFLTREFVRHYSAPRLHRLRITAMLFIFIMPFISLAAVADGWWPLAVLCCVVFFVGLLLERWLFFAEAKHTVRLYHGEGRP